MKRGKGREGGKKKKKEKRGKVFLCIKSMSRVPGGARVLPRGYLPEGRLKKKGTEVERDSFI